MALYIIVHKLKVGPEEFGAVMQSDEMPKLAKAMASGETPAKCLKSWNPLPYGKTYEFYCPWEANRTADIEATLGADMLGIITCDPVQVDEIDWAEDAKAA